jgi:hypothetical protein
MGDLKFFVYINEQSTRPLVHTITEAKQYAMRNIWYKPSLRIECYSMSFMICEWIYNYPDNEWVQNMVTSDSTLYQKLNP